VRGDFTVEGARQYLARFRFYGDDTLRVVSGFSGGERSRLALAKLLLEPRNLLFLDEPTNHLDIPAAEILEEALAGFEGTVILVSHDRRFLENTTTRIVSVREGKVDIYPGGFRDYVAAHAPKPTQDEEVARLERSRKRERDGAKKSEAPKTEAQTERDKKATFEAQRQASRADEKRKRRIEELEKGIAQGDEKLAELRAKLKEDPGGDWAKVAQLASEEQSLTKRVDQMMSEWARLSVEHG
jgi:ATP-binding cassette subfamily F protein 3